MWCCTGVVYVKTFSYLGFMYIRETKKQRNKDTKVFYQYSLVQSTRIDGKSRQRTILYLGSDKQLRDKNNRKMVLQVLEDKIMGRASLFEDIPEDLYRLACSYHEKYLIKYDGLDEVPVPLAPKSEEADYEQVDMNSLEVEQVLSFGPEHLCMQTLEKLGLGSFFRSVLGMNEKDVTKALIGIAARAIYTSTEYKTSQILGMNSCLPEYMRYKEPISHKQLYRISDLLYEHKAEIDQYFYERITDLFDLKDKIVIFDISNTYFESRKEDSKIAAYGRSKEKRNDCPLAVFTGVINTEGFIRHSRIYEGNKSDESTLMDMIEDLKHYSGSKEHVIVLDAGVATDENLEMLDKKGYKYVCVSRSRIKDYPAECLNSQTAQKTDRGKGEVKLSVFTPKGYTDTWMWVQSDSKRAKEQSMQKKLRHRFEEDLEQIESALHKKGGAKKIDKVWKRIGRKIEKHSRVSSMYDIKVTEKEGKATSIQWMIKENKIKQDKAEGIYFIRTNTKSVEEAALWQVYNTIREVESTFRCLKTDLRIRPVHHQADERIEAHLYLTMLAYQLVNTIRYQLEKKDLRYDWQNIVRIMRTQTIQTIELKTQTKTIHIRKPSKPIREVKEIYDAAACKHTQPTIKKHVVYH